MLLPADLVNPAQLAGRCDDAVFDVKLRSFAHRFFAALLVAVAVVGVNPFKHRLGPAIKGVWRQAEQLADLVRPDNSLRGQIELTVSDTPHTLGIDQFALGALAFFQLGLQLGLTLRQRVGHTVEALGDPRELAA